MPDDKPWLALFSPSTASYVLEAWQAVPTFRPNLRNRDFHLAAIGLTTKEYLTSHSYEVSATSTNPDAESLAEAIHSAVVHGTRFSDLIQTGEIA